MNKGARNKQGGRFRDNLINTLRPTYQGAQNKGFHPYDPIWPRLSLQDGLWLTPNTNSKFHRYPEVQIRHPSIDQSTELKINAHTIIKF